MEETLRDLGEILLKALPTFFLVIFLYVYLNLMFFRPMARLLEERRNATEGARRRAEEMFRQAEEKTAQHEAALQAARAEIFREQDAERRRAQEALAGRVREAREQAESQLQQARQGIAAEAAGARQSIEAQGALLADRVVRAALGKGAAA